MIKIRRLFALYMVLFLTACHEDISVYQELKTENREKAKTDYCYMMRELGLRCDNEIRGIPFSCRLVACPKGDSIYIIDIYRHSNAELIQWKQLPVNGLRFDSLMNNEYKGVSWKTYLKAIDTESLIPIKKQLDSLNFWGMQCPDSVLGPGFQPGKGKYELIVARNKKNNAVVRYSLGTPLDSVYNRLLQLADLK